MRVSPGAILVLSLTLVLAACAPDVVQRNNAGNARFTDGAYDEAIVEYRQAQVDDPDRAEPYYNASNAYNRKHVVDQALVQAQQALKTANSDLATKTWYNLGNAFFDAEEWQSAVAAYQEALRIHPDDLDAKHNLELALQKMEEQQQQQEQNQLQEDQNSAQSESGTATPSPQDQSAETAQDQAPARTTPEPVDEASGSGTETLSPEQAQQLFEALVGDGETLQERLEKIYRVPIPPPERDW